jgi:protein O-GlcNAc transferase
MGTKMRNSTTAACNRDNASERASLPNPETDDIISQAVQHYDGGRLQQAEEICRRINQLHPDHPKALNLLGIILFRSGRTEEGLSLLLKAIALQPDFAAAHSNLGNAYKTMGRFAEAAVSFQRALAIKPDSAAVLYNLGGVFEAQGLPEEAAVCYRHVVTLDPDSAEVHNSLGLVLMMQGRLDEAAACYRRALALKPNFVMALNNLGNVFEEQGRPDKAEASYCRAIGIHPDFAEGYYNLGRVLAVRGKPDEAAASYQRAVTIRPDFFMAHNNLGIIFEKLDKLDEAVTCYRRALALNPDYAQAYNNLGNACKKQDKPDEAVTCYQSALALNPDYAEAYNNLGIVLYEQGRLDEAAACYGKALGLKPDDEDVHNNLGNVFKEQGKPTDAEACYRKALALKPDYAEARSNLLFCLNYHPAISKEQLFEEHLAWDARHGRQGKGKLKLSRNDPSPNRPLRIGYVSADLGRHPVGYFLSSVLPAHDRRSFKVFCYSGRVKEDDLTLHLRTNSDAWRPTRGLDDDALAEIIRADAIDILVDLSGHTAGNRLTMFAQKPAPVQMSWLGYWATTGMAAIDYVITDMITVPPGEERFFAEKVLRLPESRFCYTPPLNAPPVAPPPFVRKGYVTFGCFNNLAKITPQVVELWADLLREVTAARLILKWKSFEDAATKDRYLEMFAGNGIGADRVELRGWSPHGAMLAEYGDIDIALDPFPFSGGLTSCEALWMGVPVITLSGTLPVSRQTAGFLTNLGLGGLVAGDAAQYLDIAAGLAREPARLAELRLGMRPRMAASPLCDGSRFARSLEAAYREAWQRWCRESH